MYVDKIQDIGDPSEIRPDRIEEAKKKPKTEEPEHKDKRSDQFRASDSTQISLNANEISRYQEMARIHREAYGPVDRNAKLADIRRKIAQGYYDKSKTMENLAERMLESTIEDAGPAGDVETIRRRSETGYYNRPQVIDRTVEKVLRELWPKKTPGEEE